LTGDVASRKVFINFVRFLTEAGIQWKKFSKLSNVKFRENSAVVDFTCAHRRTFGGIWHKY
jgi:hypothetical protein